MAADMRKTESLGNSFDSELSEAKIAGSRKSRILSRNTLLSDQYTRLVVGIGFLFVAGALLTAIFAILNGVINLNTGIPYTASEYSEVKAGAELIIDQNAESYGKLAISQIINGKYVHAEATIGEGKALAFWDEPRNQALLFAEAFMLERRGDTQGAIEVYKQTMQLLKDAYDSMLLSEETPNWAKAFGLHDNYYQSAYALAYLYGQQGDFVKRLEMLDVVLEGNSTAADVLAERGDAKLELGDIEGAIADFEEALRYIPDEELALDGLARAKGN